MELNDIKTRLICRKTDFTAVFIGKFRFGYNAAFYKYRQYFF